MSNIFNSPQGLHLTQSDLDELDAMIQELPWRDANPLFIYLQKKIRESQLAQAVPQSLVVKKGVIRKK